MGAVYGYVRVSTREQNENRQLDELERLAISGLRLIVDKQTGADFERPGYRRMMKRLKKGDLIIVKSIDRLGRNYGEILEQWRYITKERGADIRVLDMPLLDTTKNRDLLGALISDIVLQLLSFVAQSERENIRQRQKEGIQAARKRGVRFGRPRIPLPPDAEPVLERYRRGEISGKEAAGRLGLSTTTFYRRAGEKGITKKYTFRKSVCNTIAFPQHHIM